MNLKSISDLSTPSANFKFGANHLFYTRVSDGYDSLVKTYGLSFKEALKMDNSLLYDAISQNKVDIMVVYATDSLLKKFDMVILEDDKELFPAYYGTPLVRNEA